MASNPLVWKAEGILPYRKALCVPCVLASHARSAVYSFPQEGSPGLMTISCLMVPFLKTQMNAAEKSL